MPPKRAPAPYAPTRSPAPAFERSNSSAYTGTSGVSAVKRSASTKMIALTRARRRRTIARIRGQRKCTEPVASSSDLPTDHRRSDNHSESHQPQTLRSRCIGDSMDRMATGQAPFGRNSAQFADKPPTRRSCRSCSTWLGSAMGSRARPTRLLAADDTGALGGHRRTRASDSTGRSRSAWSRACLREEYRRWMNQGYKKCTEPVAPSSDFPTDRRRSDCLPESHQPWAFRTRCKADPRGAQGARQGA